jgi:hypothetical protein
MGSLGVHGELEGCMLRYTIADAPLGDHSLIALTGAFVRLAFVV